MARLEFNSKKLRQDFEGGLIMGGIAIIAVGSIVSLIVNAVFIYNQLGIRLLALLVICLGVILSLLNRYFNLELTKKEVNYGLYTLLVFNALGAILIALLT